MKKIIFFLKSWFAISIVMYTILLYMGKVLVDTPFTPLILWKHYVAAAFIAIFGAPVSLLLRNSFAILQEKVPSIAKYYYTVIILHAVAAVIFIVKELMSLSS